MYCKVSLLSTWYSNLQNACISWNNDITIEKLVLSCLWLVACWASVLCGCLIWRWAHTVGMEHFANLAQGHKLNWLPDTWLAPSLTACWHQRIEAYVSQTHPVLLVLYMLMQVVGSYLVKLLRLPGQMGIICVLNNLVHTGLVHLNLFDSRPRCSSSFWLEDLFSHCIFSSWDSVGYSLCWWSQ